MRRPSVHRRIVRLRVLVNALILSVALAAVTAIGVLADGGGGQFPR